MEKVIDGKDQRGAKAQLLEDLDLVQVLDRDVENLSGLFLPLFHPAFEPEAASRQHGPPSSQAGRGR